MSLVNFVMVINKVELLASLASPENSDSKGEEDSDSPIRQRSKSGNLVSSRTRTRGYGVNQ